VRLGPGRAALPPAIVALAKVAASAAVLLGGFRAVSDDDFARVEIAERWARAPRWDASGTSWLPFPFWITGAAMRVAGRSLDTARVTAALLGLAAALLGYVAARWMGETRGAAATGGVVAAVFPWSARLGVATVPELFTAALTLLAMAALVPGEHGGRRRLAGGAALAAATLSRYEAWPVAAIYAGVCVVDAARAREGRAARLGAASLALAGPLAWLAWNRLAHGDALHFLARVASYRRALGGDESGAAGRLWRYPVAMLREEPEITALAVASAVALVVTGRVAALRDGLRAYARPAAVAAAQIAALSLAMVKDGAPTHHPERATLAALLLVALLAGALAFRACTAGAPAGQGRATALALAGAVAVTAGIARRGPAREDFGRRADEVAIGAEAAALARPGERVLVEAADYGYLAVTAALGRPEDTERDRSVDPREDPTPSSFTEATALRRRIAACGARWAVGRVGEPVRAALGEPVAERGAWGVYRVEERP
jgi:hypothetical protein